MKKVLSLTLVLAMSLCLLAGCGITAGNSNVTLNTPTTPAPYTVQVVDAFGAPCAQGTLVRILQGGSQVKLVKTDATGKISQELPDGEYTVELKFVDESAAYYYDQSNLTLNKDKKNLVITLYSAVSGSPVSLFAPSLKEEASKAMDAYDVAVGGTYVELQQGERNYFLFTPSEAGLYHFSVQNSDAVLGYYGASYYVQNTTISQPESGIIEVNIRPSMLVGGGSALVLGLDATGSSTSAVLSIQRVGDPVLGDDDVPYQAYEPQTAPVAYTLPAGTKTTDFDLTAATYNLVMGADGFYHLDSADGPLVLVKITKDSGGSKYLAPLEEMATKSIVGKYFYDENGKLLKKEAYNQCIQDYAACADEATGMYPLTEDLKYIIQQRGDHYGWFDPDRPEGYAFTDDNGNPIAGINLENAWLLFCCYVQK